jgi:hypothetical protein
MASFEELLKGFTMSPHENYLHCILSTAVENCLRRGIDVSDIMRSTLSLNEKTEALYKLLGIIRNPCNEESIP